MRLGGIQHGKCSLLMVSDLGDAFEQTKMISKNAFFDGIWIMKMPFNLMYFYILTGLIYKIFAHFVTYHGLVEEQLVR